MLKDYDKHGKWYLWERRADWDKTSIADFGKPVPRYAMYLVDLPADKKVLMQLNHELDMIHEVTPEGMVQLAKSKDNTNWFKGFPFGHPDPTLVSILLNDGKAPFDNPDVRWALTLSLDMTKVAMASYRGAVTVSPIMYPPTGTSRKYYFDPHAVLPPGVHPRRGQGRQDQAVRHDHPGEDRHRGAGGVR